MSIVWPEPPVTYVPPFRNMYPVSCDSCGRVFKKVPAPGPHWCGCPHHDLYKFLHECVGCGSSFVRGRGPPWCSVQCKNAVTQGVTEGEGRAE